MSPRAGQAESRKRALIGAALKEISDRGSLDVTVAQIAQRAGVSSALAHHYFGGKEDLILATMRHLLAEFGSEVRAKLRRTAGPRARLTAIVRASFAPDQFHKATISAWLTFYAKALSSPGAARLLRVYQRRLYSNLVHAIRPLAETRSEEIAEMVAALIDGLYLREALKGAPSDPEAAIATIEAALDRAIETSAEEGAPAQRREHA
jgi:TetR/AcrR family transcriptional regulator, transcriptional repressor of bet genes